MKLEGLSEILSPHFSLSTEPRRVDLIVLHSTEGHERKGSARSSATWLASAQARASAHYFVDADEIIRGLPDDAIGWHAPGVNFRSIGVEHAGRAAQTEEEWSDDFSKATILRSINLVAALCRKHRIPPTYAPSPSPSSRGITTHAAVSRFYRKSTHTDPGPGFPIISYVARVQRVLDSGQDEV